LTASDLSRLARGGEVLSRFEPAAMYFLWPLTLGKEWSQEFDYRDGRFGFASFGTKTNVELFYFVLVVFAVVVWLLWRLIQTPFGHAMQAIKAIKQNDLRAAFLGEVRLDGPVEHGVLGLAALVGGRGGADHRDCWAGSGHQGKALAGMVPNPLLQGTASQRRYAPPLAAPAGVPTLRGLSESRRNPVRRASCR